MVRAVLKDSFTLIEEYDEGNAKTFEEGSEVVVIAEVKNENNYRQFIIYSPELNDSTVVYEKLLDFRV